jgi:hypothetical protein
LATHEVHRQEDDARLGVDTEALIEALKAMNTRMNLSNLRLFRVRVMWNRY